MTIFSTYGFSTSPEDSFDDVRRKLSAAISVVTKDGYSIIAVHPHVGLVGQASCTIGYTLTLSKAGPGEKKQADPLPMVLAVN